MATIPNIPNEAVIEVRTVLILAGELSDVALSLTHDRSYDRGIEVLITLNKELHNAFPDLTDASEETFRDGLLNALERVEYALQQGAGTYAWGAPFRHTGGLESRFPELLVIRKVDTAASFLKSLLDSAWTQTNVASSLRTALDDLRIPRSEIAPYNFAIKEDRLVLAQETADAGRNASVAGAARELLIERSKNLLDILNASNSPHVLAEFEAVVRLLESELNPVKLGLQNSFLAKVVAASADELADGLSARLKSFSVAISDLVAQYEDWRLFSETADSVKLSAASVKAMTTMVEALSSQLEGREELAEPEVPTALKDVASKVERAPDDSRARLSAYRTGLNLLISAAAKFRDEVIYGPAKDILGFGRAAVVLVVLTAALNHIGLILGTEGLEWLAPLVPFLQAQIDKKTKD